MYLRTVLSIALLMQSSGPGYAQDAAGYPRKPIRVVVVHAPGGIADILARMVGQRMSERLGQGVVVENRTGAAGALGSEYVANAPADGYTLMVGTVGTHAINASLYPKLRYNNLKDFAAVSMAATQPLMLAVHPSVPAGSVPELISALKASPGKYSFGSAGGAGTSGHLAAELFKMKTGTVMVHIPYKGSGPMIIDLVGGHINLAFDNMPTALAQVRSGKLRALAVTSTERSKLVPDVPAVSEFVPGFQVTSWQGFFTPAGVPGAILDRLSTEVQQIMRMPGVAEHLLGMGVTPVGNTRAEFAAFVKEETERWAEVVRVSGARADD